MDNNSNNKVTFKAWAFHLNPFGGRGFWRGFVERNTIEVTSEDITVESGKFRSVFPIAKLEILYTERKRWFGFGLKRYVLGLEKKDDLDLDYFYLNDDNFKELRDGLQSLGACFGDDQHLLVESRRSKIKLWANSTNVYTITYGWFRKFVRHRKAIKDLKYAYSRGLISKNTYLGNDYSSLKIKNITAESMRNIFAFVKQHGGNLDENEADESYSDIFSPTVIFHPTQWFYHSSIGFKDGGVVFKQKTFKTDDNIFLPYDKINMIVCKHSLVSFGAKIQIFGEQNILPKKQYSKGDAHAIEQKLFDNGVKSLQGEAFLPSYHTSWIGILLSIITLSIYHWLVVAFTKKRNQIIIGDKKFSWNNKVYAYSPDIDKNKRQLVKGVDGFVCNCDEIKDCVYLKKHWYSLWGYLFIWVHPSNIRILEGEASQSSVDYDVELSMVWFSQVRRLKEVLKDNGYDYNNSNDGHKFYKSWCKHWIKHFY